MYSHSRIKFLSDSEIEAIYAIPQFNKFEQTLYFELTFQEELIVKKYHTVKARIYFIRMLGYFKAKQQFYKFDLCPDNDTLYILEKYFKGAVPVPSGKIDLKTYQKQKNDVLLLLGFKDWSPEYEPQVQSHLAELLKLYPRGHDTLRQLLIYFDNRQIVLPSYRTLQDMFTQAFSKESDRLNQLILLIPQSKQEQLSELINKEDGISKINTIRMDQKNFQYHAIKAEVDKALAISELYEFSKDFLPTLQLPKNAIRYYADLAEQYPAYRLRRLNKLQQWLQTLCFVYHRYQQIMDHLITSFMYHTRAILDSGKIYADAAMKEHSSGLTVDLPKLAKFLKWFPNRKPGLTHDEVNQEAYKLLPEEQFPALAQFLEDNTFDKKSAIRDFYLKSSRLFSLYLRPILLAVPFVFYKEESDVMDLIDLIKDHYRRRKSPSSFRLPKDLEGTISETMIPYLKQNSNDEQVDPHLFEFFVYQKMVRRLDKGLLCCNDSVSY